MVLRKALRGLVTTLAALALAAGSVGVLGSTGCASNKKCCSEKKECCKSGCTKECCKKASEPKPAGK